MHQQGGLARGGRALEGCRGHGDDHSPALERVEHLPAGERAALGVELVSSFDEPWRRVRVEVGTERDDEDVGVERPCVGLDAFRRRIDRGDVVCTNCTPGLTMSA